ncbi:hypothetical protein [Actinoplanes rectilineatus]|uniref:hypothetical protein n=1 Tax=Actinoplanes rectilineatus TaxID=113571 RepID=UPI0005F2EA54|nr:hypothetical protein [Actinoplanes rectilineatus]
MTQQPLIPRPPGQHGRAGIWSRLKDTQGAIDQAAWTHHRDTRQHVGLCHCGQPLHPGEPYKAGPRDEYPAMCASRHEVVAHGPRPSRKTKDSA